MTWFKPLTKKQIKKYDSTCELIHTTFGSYNRIASALEAFTNVYITGQTVRTWMQERIMPVNYILSLSDLIPELDVFSMAPWMIPYAIKWSHQTEIHDETEA